MSQSENTAPPKDADLHSFHTLITRLDSGALNEELSDMVKKCVQEIADACFDRGGIQKSSLTVKLDFVMNQKDKVVEIYPTVDGKFPKAPRGRAGMFYATADGKLTRENPRQMTMNDELERSRQERRQEQAERENQMMQRA